MTKKKYIMTPLLKLQRIIIGTPVKKARVFVPTKSFLSSQIFASKARAYLEKIFSNVSQGTNTLTYLFALFMT
jgi:hypothetical protein